MSVKANAVANLSGEGINIPGNATFWDDKRLYEVDGGVLLEADGSILGGLASRDAVPDGYDHPVGGNVLKRRFSNFSMNEVTPERPKQGAELEFVITNNRGDYHSVVDDDGAYVSWADDLMLTPEMGRSMAETSITPTSDPAEAKKVINNRFAEIAQAALNNDLLVAPLGVFGRPVEINPHPYIKYITERMHERTGFPTEGFRVAGAQFHQEVGAETAIPLAKAMQQLSPLLAASSLCGPFLNESLKDVVGWKRGADDTQQNHLEKVGLTDLHLNQSTGESMRYLLRRICSFGGGVTNEVLPSDLNDYFAIAHNRMAKGDLATIDRLQGEHADYRIRWGIGTLEMCLFDTFAGNPRKIWAAQQFSCAVVRGVEKLLQQDAPLQKVYPDLFPHDPNSQQALDYAHKASLEVGLYGMEAVVNNKKVYQHFSSLEKLVRSSGQLQGSHLEEVIFEMRKSYASLAQTEAYIREWMNLKGEKTPSIQAYFGDGRLGGVGVASNYMRARWESLNDETPKTTTELIRKCEEDVGQVATRAWAGID